ncbi:MAG: hypothetical protein ACFFEK_04845 [Candidatus Thorarchaeota archaeon]
MGENGRHSSGSESLLARLVWILVILCSVRVTKKRIYIEGELDSGTTPLVSGKNPIPTLWRDENYEVFEERKNNG